MTDVLTSFQNPRVKAYAALKERKRREEAGLHLAEGPRVVGAYVQAGAELEAVLFDPDSDQSAALTHLVDACAASGAKVFEVSAAVLARIADTQHPQGIVAVARTPVGRFDRVLTSAPGARPASVCSDVLVWVNAVRDPGNLGTILRTASAVGVRAVILAEGTADAYGPKSVRASAGATARVAVVRAALDGLSILRGEGFRVLVADKSGGVPAFEANLRGLLAIVIGGETEGIPAPVRALADGAVSLPMPGGTESLNAGVAASVLMYEALRQRVLSE